MSHRPWKTTCTRLLAAWRNVLAWCEKHAKALNFSLKEKYSSKGFNDPYEANANHSAWHIIHFFISISDTLIDWTKWDDEQANKQGFLS